MKIYKVGGCVRDKLLGIKSSDNDYVVVGATHEDMLKLKFKPVGKDFPVYLHPITKEEYALARLEKKTNSGHKGFSFTTSKNVSLEDDLKRRDITINAIAEDELGNLIDPFGGINDLNKKLIRHVSAAFIEDPLRVFRVARFAGRFNFIIAQETLDLMKKVVNNNELTSISKDRIWLECYKAIATSNSLRFFKILYDIKALKYITPELNFLFSNSSLTEKLSKVLSFAIINQLTVSEKFCIIYYYMGISLPKEKKTDIKKIIVDTKLDKKTKDLILLLYNVYFQLSNFDNLNTLQIYNLIKKIDYMRKTDRYNSLFKIVNIFAICDNLNYIKNNIKLLQNIIKQASNINYARLAKKYPNQMSSQVKNSIIKIIDHTLENNS